MSSEYVVGSQDIGFFIAADEHTVVKFMNNKSVYALYSKSN